MRNNSSQFKTDGGEKKRRRGFNFIDFLLILFVLVIILTAVNIVSPISIIDRFRAEESYTILYTVELSGIYAESEDEIKIKENDTVVDAVSKYSLGVVQTVDYTEHSTLEYDESAKDGAGDGVLTAHKNKYDVLITIKASASFVAEKGYFVNDRRIAVGEKLSLRFPDYAGEGYCIGLSKDK